MGKRHTEIDIAELLLSGMPPQVVIDTLQADKSTVYKVRRSLKFGTKRHRKSAHYD